MAVYAIIPDNICLTVPFRGFSQGRIKIRRYTVIRLINGPEIACGLPDAEIAGMPISPVFRTEDMESPVIRAKSLCYGQCGVSGAVIDENTFQIRLILGLQAGNCPRDEVLHVVNGDDDRNFHEPSPNPAFFPKILSAISLNAPSPPLHSSTRSALAFT